MKNELALLLPIETERLKIRQFKPKDLEHFLDFMLDEASTQYLAFDAEQKTRAGAIDLFNLVCNSYDSDNPIDSYAIATKDSDRYIGSCGFADYDTGIYECYYCVNSTARGQGIATEAVSCLVKYLSKIAEVRAYCHPDNFAAHAVAQKSGFSPQGKSWHKNFEMEGELFTYQKKSISS